MANHPPLIQKDLTIFFRNKFYTLITVMAFVAYIGVYYLMPDTVDEIIEVGLYAPSSSAEAARVLEDDGISFQLFESETALQQATVDEEIGSGIASRKTCFRMWRREESQPSLFMSHPMLTMTSRMPCKSSWKP